jgi:hypothetical protein
MHDVKIYNEMHARRRRLVFICRCRFALILLVYYSKRETVLFNKMLKYRPLVNFQQNKFEI